MQAKEAKLLQVMSGPKQFMIPIYQRPYNWTIAQCQQLWDDIVRATDSNVTSHFIGSIVYIIDGLYQSSAVSRLLIIDGQQRLTTISLLLTALSQSISEQPTSEATATPVTHTQIRNYYLINNEEDGILRYKLLLTRGDQDTLFSVLDSDRPKPADSSQRLIENLRFFQKQIQSSNLTSNDIYRGLQKLLIVDVTLESNKDNPQLIFESLNSTGLDLSQSDLIRNYILMGLEPKHQDRLYTRFWYPIESEFDRSNEGSSFDFFMRDFLTVKNKGQIPTLRDVYKSFKQYMNTSGSQIDELVEDIYNHAKIYARFVSSELEKDSSIKAALTDIKTLKMDVVYTFLLEVFLDYGQELVTRDELVEILRLVESYVFRRAIVGIPTNSMNKTFATLSRVVDKDRYLDSVKAAFLLLDSYRRFPGDDEFMLQFVRKDVYNFRSRAYLLDKLENYGRKERADTSGYTTEHIMPQNQSLSAEWQQMLGANWKEIQSRYLHTIGNLTLTGYNSELSDRPFLEKCDMEGGFRNSPIRINKKVRDLNTWSEAEMEARARELAERAREIWAFPGLSKADLESFRNPSADASQKQPLDHHDDDLWSV